MSETDDEVAAAVRAKHDQAVIDYLEAIRTEIHDLPGRIVGYMVGAAILLMLAGWILWWFVSAGAAG